MISLLLKRHFKNTGRDIIFNHQTTDFKNDSNLFERCITLPH